MMPVTQGRDTSAFGLFMQIPQGERVQAEYIWIGGSCEDLRCKTRTLPGPVKSLADLEEWNYDGSSTGQAPGKDSEVWLRPVKYVPDPFRGGQNILVLCECLDPKDMTPIPTNNRSSAKRIFDQVIDEHPWYGLEQEYTLFENDGITPLGWPKGGYPKPQGPYYCSVGAGRAFGRQLVEAHYRCCLYAGLTISGINAEVMPGQWEYQIGPVEGIDAGDQLWISRYILERVAEAFDVSVSFQPKPIKGDWNGAGCHANFSTQKMREEGGYDAIIEGIEKLGTKHFEHMEVYGKNNRQRLTGKHETASYDNFSYGVANRGASIRIPRMSFIEKKGYFEDRRPAANMDPYLVTAKIIETVAL